MSDPSARLLDAVSALLVEDGFEGISVRKVASRAGVSIGAVQHHFPTKDAMLAAAMAQAGEVFLQRLRDRVPRGSTAQEALRELADELVGGHPEQREISVLWTLRVARAAVDPATAATHAAEWSEVAAAVTGFVQAARPDRDERWADEQAAGLLALADGLAVTGLVEPDRMPVERARRLIGAAVDRLLEGD